MLLIGTIFVVTLDTVSSVDLVEGDYTYTVSNGEATITKYNGSGGAITIPSTVGGYQTVHIGDHAFSNNPYLTSVIIPYNVTTIGSWAFGSNPSLTSITIPDSVTTIGDSAFKGTSLTSITIPSSVTSLADRMFNTCSSLTAINVDAANVNYASVDGVLYNKALTTLITCPARTTGTFTIPSSITTIGSGAFDSCTSLTAIIIPDSVTIIDGNAFYYCTSLTSMIIPNSVIRVANAFGDCSNLTTVTIGSGVSEIGSWAFDNCSSLTSITFLGLVAPISVGENWILNTHVDIRGHASSNSNFPAPGEKFNGLTMGAVIGSENAPPIADFSWTPLTPKVNQTITFDASASNDSDGSLTLYEWDWNNDGTYEDSLYHTNSNTCMDGCRQLLCYGTSDR